MLKPTLAEPLNQTAPSNLYKSQKLLLLDSAPNEFHLMKKDNLAEDAIKHRVDDWLGDLGTIHILRKHLYSAKLNLTTSFLSKICFFRQNKIISFSTLHFDKNFMLQLQIFIT